MLSSEPSRAFSVPRPSSFTIPPSVPGAGASFPGTRARAVPVGREEPMYLISSTKPQIKMFHCSDSYTFSFGGRTAPFEVPVKWALGAWSCRSHLWCTLWKRRAHLGLNLSRDWRRNATIKRWLKVTCWEACQCTERSMWFPTNHTPSWSNCKQESTVWWKKPRWTHEVGSHKFPPTVQVQCLSWYTERMLSFSIPAAGAVSAAIWGTRAGRMQNFIYLLALHHLPTG